MLFLPVVCIEHQVCRLIILYLEKQARAAIEAIASVFVRVDVARREVHQTIAVFVRLLILDDLRQKLPEDGAAQPKRMVIVMGIAVFIPGKDMHAVHVAVEPPHLIREGVLAGGIIHEDKVLVLPVALHHRFQPSGAAAVVHLEVVGFCQLVLFPQLCEVGQGIKLCLFHI